LNDQAAITSEIVTGKDALGPLESVWRALFCKVGTLSPFLSWEWMSAWTDTLLGAKEPVIVTTYRGKRLIGIMPLTSSIIRPAGISLQKFEFLGHEHSGADHLDVITQPEDNRAVLKSCIDLLQQAYPDHDVVHLANMDANSFIGEYLGNGGRPAGYRYRQWADMICPQVDLMVGWESILTRSRRSTNFKRQFKKLQRLSSFEFRSITDPNEVIAAFDRFLMLHEKRWRDRGGSDLSGHEHLRNFHRRAVKNMSRTGLVRFEELWAEGECRASVYGFDNGRTFYYFNAGFDPEWSQLSVGLVLTGLSIRGAAERGCATYDFLRGDEAYKFDWADGSVQLVTADLFRDAARGKLFAGLSFANEHIKNTAKNVIPAQLVNTLKGWRRGLKH
jgi:CelD/BcsL family acetyltransferase involved in cellulose biosynthesis